MTYLGPRGRNDLWPTAISGSGQVVGYAVPAPFTHGHAFLCSGGKLTYLGELGGEDSDAFAVNGLGQVVGRATVAGRDSHGFLFCGGRMYDLNTLLDASGRGWIVEDARAISDAGQIAAFGLNRITGKVHTVLLTPLRGARTRR